MARLLGARTRVRRRQPIARDRVWFSMRALRRFTLPMLEETAEANRSNCMKFAMALERAGILRRVVDRNSGRKGGHVQWLLVRDLGPLAPRLQSNGKTYDPNAHQVIEGGIKQ